MYGAALLAATWSPRSPATSYRCESARRAFRGGCQRASERRPPIAQLQRAQLQHLVARRVFPPGARPLHANRDQALARRLDVATADWQSLAARGGVLHTRRACAEVADRRFDRPHTVQGDLLKPAPAQLLDDLRCRAVVALEGVSPAAELPGPRLARDLEHLRGSAEVLRGVPEIDERHDVRTERRREVLRVGRRARPPGDPGRPARRYGRCDRSPSRPSRGSRGRRRRCG